MQATTLEAKTQQLPPTPPQEPERRGRLWLMAAIGAAVLLVVGLWALVGRDAGSETEIMLRDYVADWEDGSFGALPGYFSLGGNLVNATTQTSFPSEEISGEMSRLAGSGVVDVHNLAVGSSERIATATFEIVPTAGDTINGVSVWEIVGGSIRQQTIAYVLEYAPRS